MGFFDKLFKTEVPVPPVIIQKLSESKPSDLTVNIIRLLCNDFENWKEGSYGTYIHLPTRVALAFTGQSAYIYVGCNDFNGRSGRLILFDSYIEHTRLYEIFTEELAKNNKLKNQASYEKAVIKTSEYLKELKK